MNSTTLTHRPLTTPPNWFGRPLRWANLTLVQDDPGQYDPDWWLDFLRRSHCDAASWNSGGIVAFYPTQLPFHQRNANMGDSDPLGYLVNGCRKLGIFVTARVDHHATHEDAALAHPEWIARDKDGQMRRHWADPELFVTCAFSTYNSEFMTQVMQEIMTMYAVDGFNHNRWGGSGLCYCEGCRQSFEAFAGLPLPAAENVGDEGWRKYVLWQQKRLAEMWDIWDGAVRAINPNAGILPGMGGEMGRLDLAGLRQRAHSLYHDHQARGGATPAWMPGRGAKELRAVLGQKPIGLTFSVGLEGTRHRWKDSVQREPEVRIWALEGVANGMSLKFCKFSGTLYDERWPPIIERLYTELHRMEPYLHNEAPIANVALLFSQQTARFFRPDGYNVNDSRMGMYHALIEARIPFEMVHEDLLDDSDIDRFKLLILPNVACLSDAQCEQLRAYVARGGSILATHESSLYDEWGERRDNFGLSDLLGVSAAGEVEGPMKNSYLRLEHGTSHPILRGLEDAARIINGVYRVPVRANAEFDAPPVTLIPAYPDLPMEEVYPRQDHTGIAEVYARETTGGGRVAYVPWDIDRTFWEVLHPDHGQLLQNLTLWTANAPMPVEVDGPGTLDVTMWRQQTSYTVHLVNLTNSMMMRGSFREFFPVGAQAVRVRLSQGTPVKRVHLLASQQDVEWEERDGVLHFVVPSIVDHEIAAIDV